MNSITTVSSGWKLVFKNSTIVSFIICGKLTLVACFCLCQVVVLAINFTVGCINKTAGTTGISSTLLFGKRCLLKRLQRFVFRKLLFRHQFFFWTFPNFNFFYCFCRRNLAIKVEKTFLGKHILDTHSAANCHLQEFGKMSRVFHENPIFSPKKSSFVRIWELLLFCGNFVMIWWWKIFRVKTVRTFGVRTFWIGK